MLSIELVRVLIVTEYLIITWTKTSFRYAREKDREKKERERRREI